MGATNPPIAQMKKTEAQSGKIHGHLVSHLVI